MEEHSHLGYWIAIGLAGVAVTTVSIACAKGAKSEEALRRETRREADRERAHAFGAFHNELRRLAPPGAINVPRSDVLGLASWARTEELRALERSSR